MLFVMSSEIELDLVLASVAVFMKLIFWEQHAMGMHIFGSTCVPITERKPSFSGASEQREIWILDKMG